MITTNRVYSLAIEYQIDWKKIRANLRTARCSLNKMAIGVFAEKIGRSKGQVSKVETGLEEKKPTLEYLIKASIILGVSLDYLVALSKNPEGDHRAMQVAASIRTIDHVLRDNLPKVAGTLISHGIRSTPEQQANKSVVSAAEALLDDMERFFSVRENMEAFEEMPKGSIVLRGYHNLRDKVRTARAIKERQASVNQEQADQQSSIENYPLFEGIVNDVLSIELEDGGEHF